MILSGLEIEKRVQSGEIKISDFDPKRLNPNSYNLRLHNELLLYMDDILDMKQKPMTRKVIIPPEGMVISPGRVYLGRTVEHTATEHFVPMLEGRSSVGRLGLHVHVTAGFGDIGFSGHWTLELECVQPMRIYPFVEICQIYYHKIEGDYSMYASGKYQHNTDIQPSLMYMDFEEE